jgi:hypothetical protein
MRRAKAMVFSRQKCPPRGVACSSVRTSRRRSEVRGDAQAITTGTAAKQEASAPQTRAANVSWFKGPFACGCRRGPRRADVLLRLGGPEKNRYRQQKRGLCVNYSWRKLANLRYHERFASLLAGAGPFENLFNHLQAPGPCRPGQSHLA